MKKIIYFSFICILVLLCTACNGSVTRGIRHAGFSVGDKFLCEKFYPRDKDDVHYEKIRYFIGSHLINTDGKIYELSLGQVFANGENCKDADTDIRVKAIFDNKIIKGIDNKYYYLSGQNSVPSYSEVPVTDNSYNIYDILLKGNDIVKVLTANSSIGSYYVLKTDGNVYEYILSSKERNKPIEITSTKVIYDRSAFGSDIIDFNYAGNSVTTYIKTDSKLYRMKIVNLKECKKYADVTCIYEMSEDTQLEEYWDRIITYNGSTVITDYKQMFSVSN